MRTLAIGDIHGCYKALKTLESFAEISPKDRVVALGDYIDKGPNVSKVLDWLCDRADTGKLVALRGNHDLMMLEARDAATHPEVREALDAIAEDEARHAELAWRFVRWAVEQPGADGLKDEVLATLRSFKPRVDAADEPLDLAPFGLLSDRTKQKARRRARTLLSACADQLA